MSAMFSDVLPDWPLESVADGLQTAHERDVFHAIAAAERDERLTPLDFMALLSPAATPHLETMARLAQNLTRRQFGRAIQLFTPLYLANFCTNRCVYCGFNVGNHIHRSMLSMDEVETEGKTIAATGLRHILLLTGDAPKKTGPDYIAEASRRLRPYFPSIAIEVYSMSEDEYRMLIDAGVESFTMFQETYNEALYATLHPAGPKRDFLYRLNAPDRAARAGMHAVNVGALLGLDAWRRDAFYTGLHAEWLQETYPGVDIAVSAPRMCPHEGSFNDIHPASELDLVQYIQALRLFLPSVGITLSTRERPALRDRLISLGITKISAGVSTAVGGHVTHKDCEKSLDTAQFEIADTRNVDEMAAAILSQGYQPVYKCWEPLDQVYACGQR
ncbi:MAG: 2-iminoacetate synthase ThiH [Bilophila sp.]